MFPALVLGHKNPCDT